MKMEQILENGNREAMFLSHDKFRLIIDIEKGMVPELSFKKENGWINAHWNPWFRANSGEIWNENIHGEFWKSPLLYDIAGNFSCIPNFGPDCKVRNYNIPAHGFTADGKWCVNEKKNLISDEFIGFNSILQKNSHPFHYEKTDLIIKDHDVHYSGITILNTGTDIEPYNYAWHNTVGAPFLERGCIVDNNAVVFAVPAQGGEFDSTGRLEFGAETDSLENVPLRNGGVADLRKIPGVIGYTDFISGAVSRDCELCWNTVVNPGLKMVYISFSPGPAATENDEISLYFHDLWMNFGGRSYPPWAAGEGLTDMTFCLGAENATGYFANSLKDSLDNPVLLGFPTYKLIKPGKQKMLLYGTALDIYNDDCLDKGVRTVETDDGYLVLTGYSGKYARIKADWKFQNLKSFAV